MFVSIFTKKNPDLPLCRLKKKSCLQKTPVFIFIQFRPKKPQTQVVLEKPQISWKKPNSGNAARARCCFGSSRAMLRNSAYLQIPYTGTYNLLLRNYVQLSQHATALLSKGMMLSIPQTFVSSVSDVETVRQAPHPPSPQEIQRICTNLRTHPEKSGGSGPAWTHCWRSRCHRDSLIKTESLDKSPLKYW